MTIAQAEAIYCKPCRFPTARHPSGLTVLLGIRRGDMLEVKMSGRIYTFPVANGGIAECAYGHVTNLPGA